MTQTTMPPALAYLNGRQLTAFSGFALRVVVTIVAWEELRKTRKSLGKLDDHILRDIGLTRAQAKAEARRSVWDAAPHWRDR